MMEDSHAGALRTLAAYLSAGAELEQDALLRMMMGVGVALVKADEGSLLLVEAERQELVFRATVGSAASEAKLKNQRVPLHEGIVEIRRNAACAFGSVEIWGPIPAA